MDRRAEAEVAGLPAARIQETTGLILDPTHMAAKARWLKRHAPERARIRRFHQPVSYLVAPLTGAHVIDHGLASTTMLYGLASRSFDAGLLDLFELDADELPAIAEADSCAGRLHAAGAALTGLPPGHPGRGRHRRRLSPPRSAPGWSSPGRSPARSAPPRSSARCTTRRAIDRRGCVETHGYPGGRFFIENPGWLAGRRAAWFVETFRLRDAARAGSAGRDRAGRRRGRHLPAGAERGHGAGMDRRRRAAAFYGLTPAHGSGHLARAVLEGCAFAMRDVLERLRELAVAIGSIRLLGGGARSRIWAQIRADLAGLPVAVPTDRRHLAARRGRAGRGRRRSAARPARGSAPGRDRGGDHRARLPAPGAAYDDAYGAYRRLFDCLRPMFEAAR